MNGIFKFSLTQKICLSGLLIALTTILQKVIAINYLAALPFFRISFGAPALIIFGSIFLGPLWGGIIGLFSDILGYFAFDASSFPFMPQISLIYLVLGVVGYFVYILIKKIRKPKILFAIEAGILVLFSICVSAFLIGFYECSIYAKIFIPLGLFLLILILLIFQKIVVKKEDKQDALCISFTYLVCDFVVLLVFGSLMKALAFSASFQSFTELLSTIFITQSLVMIFNVCFNTILLITFFKIMKRYVR